MLAFVSDGTTYKTAGHETGSTALHGTSSRPKPDLNIPHTNNDSDTRKKGAIGGTLLEKQA